MLALDKAMLLYAVTPAYDLNDASFFERIESALAGGVTCLQMREKDVELIKTDAYISLMGKISKIAQLYDIPLIINDWIDLAKEVGAQGVHLGQDDALLEDARSLLGKDAIVGISVHSTQEALRAEEGGADYLGVGALFPTNTKLDAELVELEELRCITSAVDIPVVGIGGITYDNMTKLSSSGIKGIAVVSALFSADNIQDQACMLRNRAEKLFW